MNAYIFQPLVGSPFGGDAHILEEEAAEEDGDHKAEEETPEEAAEETFLAIERHLDHDSPLEVRPACGVLPPDSDTEFLLTFCPAMVGDFHNVVELVLQCIPDLEKKAGGDEVGEGGEGGGGGGGSGGVLSAVDDDDNFEDAKEMAAAPPHQDAASAAASTPLPARLHPQQLQMQQHHLRVQHHLQQQQQPEAEAVVMPAPSLSDFFSALPKTAEDLALKELRVAEFEVKGR